MTYGSHVDGTLHTELGTDCCSSHAVLTSSGFGNNLGLPYSFRKQKLA